MAGASGDGHGRDVVAHGRRVRRVGSGGGAAEAGAVGGVDDLEAGRRQLVADGVGAGPVLGGASGDPLGEQLLGRGVDVADRDVVGGGRRRRGEVQAEDVVEVFGREPGATLQGLARDNANLLGETYHTQGALRFGDYIGKISLAPASKNVRALTGRIIKDVDFSAMRDLVVDFFRDQGAEYTLRVQLATDLDRMPIENAAVQWDEESSPQQSLASLTFEAQDAFSPARRVYGDDVLHFNPWQCVEAHQPLGSINRIRRAAYAASTLRRHELNAVERHEPATLDEIPD